MACSYVPECEVVYEDGKDSSMLHEECVKNPGHFKFISVKDFTIKHLSGENRSPEMMAAIRELCNRTVKVTVKFTSPNRPDTFPNTNVPFPYAYLRGSKRAKRTGTGCIFSMKSVNEPCPCPKCVGSEEPRQAYWKLQIRTAAHVVYDELEAVNSKYELFFDSENSEEVKVVHAIGVHEYDADPSMTDLCLIWCVTHDLSEVELKRLVPDDKSMIKLLNRMTDNIIVSHPHGRSKKITVGKLLYHVVPNISRKRIFNKFEDIKRYSIISSSGIPDLVFGKPLIPGEKYQLPEGVKYNIPGDADYLCKFDADWSRMTFPPGTTFFGPDDCRLSLTPETTMFYCERGQSSQRHFSQLTVMYRYSIAAYDTPTCPGSSGARVERLRASNVPFDHSIISLTHAGHLRAGVNQSFFAFSSGPFIFENFHILT